MHYENLTPIAKNEAELVFKSGVSVEIGQVLIRLSLYENDWYWVQEKCLYYIETGDNDLKNASILSLAHLARIHRKLDIDLVIPKLQSLRGNPLLQGRVEDALDDIEIFIMN
jgi:hypothetical protein